MRDNLRFLLLQVRNGWDPMRKQEVRCFARALHCDAGQIAVHDLLGGVPSRQELNSVDVVLLGGSGEYSVAEGGHWLPPALEAMQELYERSKPTFASCWGFQAFARALGGEVVTDVGRAELGSVPLFLTDDGRTDPLFAPLGDSFLGMMGHQDIVDRLPADAVLLASSERVAHQAFTFRNRPIYCTQFHPELDREGLLDRMWAYPHYVERIAGVSTEAFAESLQDTPQSNALLARYVDLVIDGYS